MSQAKASPRRVALRTLRDIEQREGFSNRLLAEQLERHAELERRDRGLITTLVYGVLRQRARLDALIDTFASKPSKLKGELRMILRLAAFEIIELGRPLAIANAEANKLARRIDAGGRLSGVTTAILSAIDRQWQTTEQAWREGDAAAWLERRWSLPRFIATRWLAQLGREQAEARARALAEPPTVDLRVDLSRSDTATMRAALEAEQPGLTIVALPHAAGEQPQCLRVRGGGDLFYAPSFEAGLISIQSLGSQQAVRALDPQPGERVLDACAGMGTKTVQIAEHMQRRGTIVAVDASAERLAELEAARDRCELGVPELRIEVIEARLGEGPICGLETDAGFDAVLVDAPCTGLGNLGRHPELRWTSSEANIHACAQLQAKLLPQCAALVRPGGRLVYAVCSLEPEEGQAIVDAFVHAQPEFTLLRTQAWTPEQHQTDGFWLALLQRT